MTSQLLRQSHMREFPRRGKKPLAALCLESCKGGINSSAFYEMANVFEWHCYGRSF